MSDFSDRIAPLPVSPEEKGATTHLQNEFIKSGIDQNSGLSNAMRPIDASVAGIPALNIGAREEGFGWRPDHDWDRDRDRDRDHDRDRDRDRDHDHRRWLLEDRGPLGLGILPRIEGAIDELATGHRHHGGYYPYEPGGFGHYEAPHSSGQFQTNKGVADFRGMTYDPERQVMEPTGRHGGYYPYAPGGFGRYNPPESSGQFQTNTGEANFERTGHDNAFHHPFGPGGWYPMPHRVEPFTKLDASGGDNTLVERSVQLGSPELRTGHNHIHPGPIGGGYGYYPYPLPYGPGRVEPTTGLDASGGYNTQIRRSQRL